MRPHPLLTLLLLPLVPLTSRAMDARLGTSGPEHEVLYLWSGDQVRRLADGFAHLLADVYWLRTVQYFGSHVAEANSLALLRPLVEITTRLDPRMEIAYRYGATFLAEPAPSGAGDPRGAIAVLERGVENLPASWRLRQDLALFHYFFLGDARTAARILLEGVALPGAPPVLKTLAAEVLGTRGELQTARRLWQRIYEEAEPGAMQDNAALHIAQIDALDALDSLRRALQSLRARTGRWPSSLEELRRTGLVRGSLADPSGVPFEYNPGTGEVSIAPTSILWRRSLAQVNR